MYHIAIYDSEDISLQETVNLLQTLFKASDIEVSLDPYYSQENLIQSISKNPSFYDLLLFGITDHTSTYDFRVIYHLQSIHMMARIILIAPTIQYVFDGYDIGAFHYLLKPLDADKLNELLLKDYHQNYLSNKVMIPAGIEYLQLTPKDIVYLEVINKTIHIRYWDDDDYFQGTLNNLKDIFCSYHFLQTHRSYLVNSDYIQKISRTSILLKNGDSVPVSKYRYKELLEQFPINLNKV